MANKQIYKEEEIRIACKKYSNYIDIVKFLTGKDKVSNTTIKKIKEKIKILKIDFKPVRRTPEKRRRTTAEILTHNPNQSTRMLHKTLKKAMIDSKIVHECKICSNPGIYNGIPLRLEIDHIDGNWQNNKLENLRFICPNCHGQTKTSNSNTNERLSKIYTDEKIKQAYPISKNVTEISKYILYTEKKIEATVTKYIKSRILILNLNLPHFKTRKTPTPNIATKENTLILNESLKKRVYTTPMKRLMIEEGLVYCCDICKQSDMYMGKSLKFDIDHINGNWKDNRIENLRFLCRNCHTQTDTYGTGTININNRKLFTKEAIEKSILTNFTVRDIVKDILKKQLVEENTVNFLYTRISTLNIDINKHKD